MERSRLSARIVVVVATLAVWVGSVAAPANWFAASDGSRTLVAQAKRVDGALVIQAALAEAPGPIPEGSFVEVARAEGYRADWPEISVAWAAPVFLLVWKEDGFASTDAHIYAMRVASDGEPLGGRIHLGSSGGSTWPYINPRVASNGENFLVVWDTWPSDHVGAGSWSDPLRASLSGPRVRAALVSPLGRVEHIGEVLGAAGWVPSVASDGTSFFTVARAALDYGVFLNPDPIPFCPSIPVIGAVCSHSGQLVGGGIIGARISGEGEVLSPLPIRAAGFSAAVVAGGNDGYLVAWKEGGGSEESIRAVRVNQHGLVLDPVPLELGVGGVPEVTWTGNRYAVAWNQGDGIAGIHFEPSGAQVDAFRIENAYGPAGRPGLTRAPGDHTGVVFIRDGQRWVEIVDS